MVEEGKDYEEEEGLGQLFICEEYSPQTFCFGDLHQRLLGSNMSCTAHDLTGQIVWPAARLLAHFMHSQRSSLADRVVLELGAGCGLAGYVAANYCKRCFVTDGNEIVVRLLAQNKEFLQATNVEVRRLVWADIDQLQCLLEESDPIDLVIGADVILWPQHIEELVLAIRLLLASNPM